MATTGLSMSNDEQVLKSGCGKEGEGLNMKKDKNHVKKWLNDQPDDIQLSLSFADWEKNIPTLSSDSEDSEAEEEEEENEEFKQKGDLKERILSKLIKFDSVDELEDDQVYQYCDRKEGSKNLTKELDTPRANMGENKWMNYLQLDGFDLEVYTNIDGLKEDMSAMMFQDGKYKKVKHNENMSSN